MADKYQTASTEMAALIPELWSAAFLPTLLASLPFAESVGRDYDREIQALGDTVNVSGFPEFDEAAEIGEAEAVDADAVTVSGTQIVINKQVAKDFQITKKAQKQSIEALNALRDLALYAILKKMNSIIIAELVPSASSPDHQIAYDTTTTLALADIIEAKGLLDLQNVEKAGRVMIAGELQANQLFNITGFVSRDFIPAGSPLTSGQIQSPVLGFTPKSSTTVGNNTYLFHPLVLQLAVQQQPDVEVVSRGGDGIRAMRVNMDVLFGVKLMSSVRAVLLS